MVTGPSLSVARICFLRAADRSRHLPLDQLGDRISSGRRPNLETAAQNFSETLLLTRRPHSGTVWPDRARL